MKKNSFYSLLCLMLLFGSYQVLAQGIPISGTVTDENGEGIVGVTVLVKGTTNGTITDIDGSYKLTVSSTNDVIVFSSIGFSTKEITVGAQTTISPSLNTDLTELDEVVVIGFGVEKKVNLSGAVDQVDIKQLEKRPISNVAEGLQGAIPNLNIVNYSGEPGSNPKINIRGITSINGGDPLILIDGVPSSSQELNRLAPQDIASISVIKDASAAAIYGARAAFGVLLITTKMGNSGISVDYTSYVSFNKPTVLPNKVTDPYIYMRIQEQSTDNTPWDVINYSEEAFEYARDRSDDPSIAGVRVNPNDETLWQYMGNRDWSEYFLDDYAVASNHQISLKGGAQNVRYMISGSFSDEQGALSIGEDYFKRGTVRSKVDYDVAKWLTVGNNTYYLNTERNRPSYFNITSIYNFAPMDWDVNPDGTWANTGVGRMAAQLTDGGESVSDYNGIQSQFNFDIKLIEDVLSLKSDYTFRKGFTNDNWYQTIYNIGYGPGDVREQGDNAAYRANTQEDYQVFNIYANYSETFGQHGLSAIVGFNSESYHWNKFTAQRNDVISASLPTIGLATGDQFVGEDAYAWAVSGLFYRLNYIFDEKYIIELNGRYDGSSKFPSDARYGFFPSMSVAWRMDQESFMQGISQLSNLKLRASYGTLGNQGIGPYEYIPTMDARQGNYLIGGQLPLEVSAPQLVSANFTWETVSTINLGVDIGLFEDRVSASFDWYNRQTKDMLTLGAELPGVLGATEPKENAADLETKGWELSLGYNEMVNLGGKSLGFNVNFVLSDSRSFITSFDNPSRSLTQFYEGMELGEIWGLNNDGFMTSQEEIDALDQSAIVPWGALNITEGWPKYVDQNGDGAITKGNTVDDPGDLTIIGNVAPRYSYGMNLGANYAGFDISVFFQGVAKRDFYPQDYLYWGFYQQPYAGGYPHLFDYYRAADESADDRARHSQSFIEAGLADQNLDARYPHLQAWLADRNLGERIDQAQGLAIPQSDYLLSAAYLRLKNLTLGYSLPGKLSSKAGLSNVRLYLSGENLFEWSEVKDYYDPEAINDNVEYNPSVSRSRGVGKGYTYPYQRRYVVGINLNF